MKKIKLLSSLTTLAVVGTSVPVLATSCNEKQIYDITEISVEGKKLENYKTEIGDYCVYKAENFSGKVNDKDTKITKLHISTSDSSIVPVNWNQEDQSFAVSAVNQGDCKINFVVEDANGNRGVKTCDVHVHAYVTKTYNIVKVDSKPSKIQTIEECYTCGEERTITSEQDWNGFDETTNEGTDFLCSSLAELTSAAETAVAASDDSKTFRFFIEGEIGDVDATTVALPKKAAIYGTVDSSIGLFKYKPTENKNSTLIFDGVLFNGTEDAFGGLVVKGDATHNIDYLTITNCKFDNNSCIKAQDNAQTIYNLTVENCEFCKINAKCHAQIITDCKYNWVWIYNNYFHDYYYNAIQNGGAVSTSYQIENNTFDGGAEYTEGQSAAMTLRYPENLSTMPQIIIQNNRLFRCNRDNGGHIQTNAHDNLKEQYQGGIIIKQSNAAGSTWDFEKEFVHCDNNTHDYVELIPHIDNSGDVSAEKWVWFSKAVSK